jgi:hypothetical protein
VRRAQTVALAVITVVLGLLVVGAVLDVLARPWPTGGAS